MKTAKLTGLILIAAVQARVALAQPAGLYALDDKLTFNVVDGAAFNRTNGQITLIGHRDSRFQVQIPYLQDLAELLEHPNPEFSLEWTPQAAAAVNALFRRMDSQEEMKR